jgi:hypothetical protein
MYIKFNEETYNVPVEYEQKLTLQALQVGLDEYEKLAREWKVLAMPFSRAILALLEKNATGKMGKEQATKLFRPEKKADPNIFLAHFIAKLLQEAMKHVTLTCETDAGSTSVSSFNLTIEGESESGRRLGTGGSNGVGQDNSTEVP